jgi:hypothetical protein
MVRWVVFYVVPYIRKSLHLENIRGSVVPTVKRGRGSVIICAAVSWYIFLLVPLLPFMGRITAREYVDRLDNQVHPMMQTLFPTNDAVSQDDSGHIWNCSVMV